MDNLHLPTQRELYTKTLADSILVSTDDLNSNEVTLINKAYEIFIDGQADIKALSDEVKRLSIEMANVKAMQDTSTSEKYLDGGECSICGRTLS